MSKISLRQVKEYLECAFGFSNNDSEDDIQAFWDEGAIELVCVRLVSAGAIEPNCEEDKRVIEIANKVSFEEERKQIDEVLAGYFLMECSACNHVGFYKDEPNELDHRCCGCAGINTSKKSNWDDLGKGE